MMILKQPKQNLIEYVAFTLNLQILKGTLRESSLVFHPKEGCWYQVSRSSCNTNHLEIFQFLVKTLKGALDVAHLCIHFRCCSRSGETNTSKDFYRTQTANTCTFLYSQTLKKRIIWGQLHSRRNSRLRIVTPAIIQ